MAKVIVVSAIDPSGLAGTAQDIRAMLSMKTKPAVVITAVTEQDDTGVHSIEPTPIESLKELWKSAIGGTEGDIHVKIGLVPTVEIAETIRDLCSNAKATVIMDTPMISSSGGKLTVDDPVKIYSTLLPIVHLATPNLAESALLSEISVGTPEEMVRAGQIINTLGCENVLVKGGTLGDDMVDVLVSKENSNEMVHPRIGNGVRGSGCLLSSIITALVSQGMKVDDAVPMAIDLILPGMEGVNVGGMRAFDFSKLVSTSL